MSASELASAEIRPAQDSTDGTLELLTTLQWLRLVKRSSPRRRSHSLRAQQKHKVGETCAETALRREGSCASKDSQRSRLHGATELWIRPSLQNERNPMILRTNGKTSDRQVRTAVEGSAKALHSKWGKHLADQGPAWALISQGVGAVCSPG